MRSYTMIVSSHTTVVYGNIRCPYTSAYDNRICAVRNGSIYVTCANIKELIQFKQAFTYETNNTKYRLWLLCLMGAIMLLPHAVWGQGVWVYNTDGTFSCTIDGGTETITDGKHTDTVKDESGDLTTISGRVSHIQLNSGKLIWKGKSLGSTSVTAGGTIQIEVYKQ